MAKFDGLVWKKGDDGWKDIPAGIGYVSKDFDPETDDAALRVEDAVKAGYGGKSVDFRDINDLLKACPPEGTVSTSNPPKVIYAAAHPTNLRGAIIVWSAPVILLDPSKIAGGEGVSLNGRVMTLTTSGVKIDGSDSVSVNIQAGAVGAYGTITDPDVATVEDTSDGMYAGAKNDTSVGTDQTSQTAGQDIPLFVPCAEETVTVSVSFTYKMEDAVQPCGEPHKIWGACYCIWGTTTPMEVFPFGTVMDLDPASLAPPSTYYGGTVSSDSYVDRGTQFTIAVAGVAGPVIGVASANDRALPLQPGQVVSFKNYLCGTVCGIAEMTQLETVDEALAYVDEDIVKPKERTLPVYTFIETTYYLTTMNAILTTEIPAISATSLLTEIFSSLWNGTSVYGTAVLWTPELEFPQGLVTAIKGVDVAGTEWWMMSAPDYGAAMKMPADAPFGGFQIAADPQPVGLVRDVEVAGKDFVHTPVDVVCRVFPTGGKAVDGNAQGTAIRQASQGPYAARFMPNPGAAVSGAVGTATLTLSSFDVDQIPSGGKVITSIGTTTLTVCDEAGDPVTITIVTSIGTAGADPISFNALTFGASLAVVTSVPTSPADVVTITTASSLPDVYVITSVPVLDPLVTTAITGQMMTFATTAALLPQTSFLAESIDVVTNLWVDGPSDHLITASYDVFIVTGAAAPASIELTKYSALASLTAFSVSGDDWNYAEAIPGSTLTLPYLDPVNKIPILDTAGPEDKAVKLLISNTDGELSLIGMPARLIQRSTSRSPLGVCTPGSVSVSSGVGGFYEDHGEIKLLAPMPVQKGLGTANDCPCFTSSDPDGGPTPPTDNSSLGSYNPCTMRVRRLQLRECHV